MTPEQKLKREIILKCRQWDSESNPDDFVAITDDNIDALWQSAKEDFSNCFHDANDEIRTTGEDSGIPDTNFNRHYESKQVACKCCDGSWVGWTYWYGGGKHGNPEEIDWIEDAYDVSCTVEMQPVNVFTKP